MRFEPERAASYDAEHDVRIFRARVMPGDAPEEAEFEFPIVHGEKTDSYSCSGRIVPPDNQSPYETRVIHIEGETQLFALLRLKRTFQDEEGDFAFLCSFADGLTAAYVDGYRLHATTRFIVTIDEALMRDRNLEIPAGHSHTGDGRLVISDRLVKAQIGLANATQ